MSSPWQRLSNAMPKRKRAGWFHVTVVTLFVNGLIFLFYAAFVPTYVRDVHWLITLAAVLLIAALPGVHYSMRRLHSIVERILAVLFGFGMVILILSDVLFALSVVGGLTHDVIYATGNVFLLLYVLTVALASFRGIFNKWLGYLSLVTAITGFATYAPFAPALSALSLLLIGAWSIALGFSILRLKRRT